MNKVVRIQWTIGVMLATWCVLAMSCAGEPKGGEQHKPEARGLPYELVVIVQRSLYEGELKDTLEHVLKASTPVLPQHEPMFRMSVAYADGRSADGHLQGKGLTPWRTFRNRFVIDVDARAQGTAMGVAKDPVARPQTEVRVTASTVHEAAVFIGENCERLCDIFVDAELETEAARLRRKHSQRTAQALQRLTDTLTVCVPTGLNAVKAGQDFLWTGTNLNDRDQNFVFYTYPWDGRPLTGEAFVACRDSALKVNIPGSQPDQWMQTACYGDAHGDGTSTEQPLILARTRIINKVNVLEVHGLWELRNGALGGPFVALSRVDTMARKVLVTEGFVYSPNSPKRPLIRQMEAALRTLHRRAKD